ncbi:MAG: hypothetical protein AB7G44_00990 [Bacteroidia bacterium]
MEASKNINLEVVNSYSLHHESYEANHPLVVTDKAGGKDSATVYFTYDYERLTNQEWLFHADVTLNYIPYGKQITRTTFNFVCSPAELFSKAIISLIIKEAIKNAITSFTTYRAHNNMPVVSPVEVPEQVISNFAADAIEIYNKHFAQQEKDNYALASIPGMKLTPGGYTTLTVKGTFMILNHILYEDPVFDNEYNRNALGNYMTVEIYQTLKWKCLHIENEDVQLSWFHTVLFFLCLDCALQLLLGEHADKLTPRLEKYGMIPSIQKDYIKFSSDMLRNLKQQMKNGGMIVSNLDEQIDWNSLMR